MNDVNKAVEDVEKIGATLSSIIPQLFFDVIARLIPGFTIFWSIYIALYGNKIFPIDPLYKSIKDNYLPSNEFFLFAITVVIFYVISIAFYGLWAGSIYIFHRVLKKVLKIDINNKFVEVLEAPQEFSFRHDYIKLKAPIAGNRITKLKAEIHMSGALTATFIICLIITLLNLTFGSSLSQEKLYLMCVFFFLGALGFYVANHHFSTRLERSVYSYSDLLNYKKKPE